MENKRLNEQILKKIESHYMIYDIYSRIEALLKFKNISKRTMAKDLNICYSTLTSMFNRQSQSVNLETIKEIANYLGVTVDYLLSGKLVFENKKLNAPEVESGLNKTTQDKYEYLKDFARRIERTLEVTEKIPQLLVDIAGKHRIVIVHATGEDMIEFLGFVNQQVCSTMYLKNSQEIKLDERGNALGTEERDYTAKVYCYRYSFGWSWLFKMDKHVKFEIFADKTGGLHWCQGIVFYLDDIKNQDEKVIGNFRFKEVFGTVLTGVDVQRKRLHVIGNKKNDLTFEFALDTESNVPLVIYKNKTFVLSWIDIWGLAMNAFEKEQDNGS